MLSYSKLIKIVVTDGWIKLLTIKDEISGSDFWIEPMLSSNTMEEDASSLRQF
jgi:hypothetical protein